MHNDQGRLYATRVRHALLCQSACSASIAPPLCYYRFNACLNCITSTALGLFLLLL